MIGLDLAIRQLAFAQARTSIAEAMMIMVGHQQEVERSGSASADQEAEQLSEQAKEIRTERALATVQLEPDETDATAPSAPHIDKLA